MPVNPSQSIKTFQLLSSAPNKPYKCFTFFNSIESAWCNLNIKPNLIALFLEPFYDWMPVDNYQGLHFYLHSPNSFPRLSEENFFYLDKKFIHTILYTKINTQLLGSGYDTICYDYELDY